jgi:hypothetical protein
VGARERRRREGRERREGIKEKKRVALRCTARKGRNKDHCGVTATIAIKHSTLPISFSIHQLSLSDYVTWCKPA